MIKAFDAPAYSSRIGGEIIDFKPEEHMASAAVTKMAPVTQFAVAAAKMAVEDGGLIASLIFLLKSGYAAGSSSEPAWERWEPTRRNWDHNQPADTWISLLS